jgi:hypothetical protein
MSLHVKMLGIPCIGAFGPVMPLAHMYNALRQQKLLKRTWPDMDLLISFHTEQRIFIGHRPQSLQDIYRRLCLAEGLSPTKFAQNKRGTASVWPKSASGPRTLSTNTTPVTDTFLPWFNTQTGFLDFSIEQVEQIVSSEPSRSEALASYQKILDKLLANEPDLEEKLRDRDKEALSILARRLTEATADAPTPQQKDNLNGQSRSEARKKQWQSRKALALLQLLEALFNALTIEAPLVKFDYFSMHRQCWTLMRHLAARFDTDIRNFGGSDYSKRDTDLPQVVHFILGNASGLKARGGDSSATQILSAAAEVADSFLESGQGSVETVSLLRLESVSLPDADLGSAGESKDAEEPKEPKGTSNTKRETDFWKAAWARS